MATRYEICEVSKYSLKEVNAFTEKMDKSVAFLEETLAEIRAGRANPAVLNKITIAFY